MSLNPITKIHCPDCERSLGQFIAFSMPAIDTLKQSTTHIQPRCLNCARSKARAMSLHDDQVWVAYSTKQIFGVLEGAEPNSAEVHLGEPSAVEWYRDGDPTNFPTIASYMQSRLPKLMERADGNEDELAAISEQIGFMMHFMPLTKEERAVLITGGAPE